jgi:hypothetical protein
MNKVPMIKTIAWIARIIIFLCPAASQTLPGTALLLFLMKSICCSKTRLTGESWFHISTPLGIEPGSLIMGSKRVDHWTSETVYECSEIAGSPQCRLYFNDLSRIPCAEDQLANTFFEKNNIF